MSEGAYVIIGVLIGCLPNLIVNSANAHRETQATAQAFIGEISSIIEMAKIRAHVQYFQKALAVLKSGTDLAKENFDFGIEKDHKDPVFTNYIQKIGIFSGDMPSQLGCFYAQISGIRMDVARLGAGTGFFTIQDKIRIIEQDLGIWTNTEALGLSIIKNLNQVARTSFLKYLWNRISGN